MQYLYHRLPPVMEGSTLYPLNKLRGIFPDLFNKEVAKYIGRPHIVKQRITLFDNCLWNDVLFFTAVNPQDIYDARRNVGWGDVSPQKYLKIDPSTLDSTKLGVYLFDPGRDGQLKSEKDFEVYDNDELSSYAIIPQATKDYFKQELDSGKSNIKLFFKYIPHILYKGSIDISDAEIITVS